MQLCSPAECVSAKTLLQVLAHLEHRSCLSQPSVTRPSAGDNLKIRPVLLQQTVAAVLPQRYSSSIACLVHMAQESRRRRAKRKKSCSDEEAANFIRNQKERRRSRLDDVSFDDGGGPRSATRRRHGQTGARRAAARGRRGVGRWAAAAKPRKSEDSQDFELVGVQTAEGARGSEPPASGAGGRRSRGRRRRSDAPPPLGHVCVLKSDGADGERVPLHETLNGRALDNDVRVPVARCSRLHAELIGTGESTLQNHARAANTTVLRGEPLNRRRCAMLIATSSSRSAAGDFGSRRR